MREFEKLQEACAYLQRYLHSEPPTVSITLGSGLGSFADQIRKAEKIPYGDIPHFPKTSETVQGHAGRLVIGWLERLKVAIMDGRVHPYQGISFQEAVFPTRLMGVLGVKTVIITHSVGAFNLNYRPGELAVVRDHIFSHLQSPLAGPNENELGPRFPDMNAVYDPDLVALAMECARQQKVTLQRAVAMFHLGPQYETPAEVEQMRRSGGDFGTMSSIYEAIAAHHMGKRVLDIAAITNMGSGILPEKHDHDKVLERGRRLTEGLVRLVRAIVAKLAKNEL